MLISLRPRRSEPAASESLVMAQPAPNVQQCRRAVTVGRWDLDVRVYCATTQV